MAIDWETAQRTIDALALLLLGSALASVLVQRLTTSVGLIAVQGILLGGAAAAVALASGEAHAYAALVVTVVAKALGVPVVLGYALRHLPAKREVETVVSHKVGFAVGCGLVLLAYQVAPPIGHPAEAVARDALPAALSLLLLGLFTMATRRKALTQVVALVMMENGVYFAALVATRGLPLAVELGVAADILVGVIVMALVARQIQHTFDTLDIDRLRALRG